MERLKNEEGQNAVDMANQIEELKFQLAVSCTYVQLSHCDLEEFKDEMSDSRQRVENLLRQILVGCQYNMDHVLPRLRDNIDDCISSCYHSTSSATMTDEQIFPLATQYEILQKVSGNMKDFIWNDRTYGDSWLFKLAHLLMKIIPIELENFRARNIHVMIEFLLIILTDMPEDFIHHDKLCDLLARVGALIGEVSTLVHDLEEKSRNEESTNEKSRATLDFLEEKIELLKEDLKCVYLKAPDSYQCCFSMNDGPLFMHLLLIHFNDLLESNSYSISLIKDDIRLVKEALEFIRSYFVNAEKGLYKDLWAHILDVAYEAKDVIDSIIVRDNGLLHLIFSLPITIRKIKLIREEVYNLPGKIPKNKSLVVVNSPKNPVERKSLTTGKIIVGFKEETNWLISKLTSGPKDLDVISITGMSSSGKTTLA
ncbi:putative late blight resistance protein -like protein R1B-14-like, partial [Capsicum annuum]